MVYSRSWIVYFQGISKIYRRRQEERFPVVPMSERLREEEDLDDDQDEATGDDPSQVPGGRRDRRH